MYLMQRLVLYFFMQFFVYKDLEKVNLLYFMFLAFLSNLYRFAVRNTEIFRIWLGF